MTPEPDEQEDEYCPLCKQTGICICDDLYEAWRDAQYDDPEQDIAVNLP